MTRYGYYDSNDKFIETPQIQSFLPKPSTYKRQAWRCAKCNNKMRLIPISLDIPAEYWQCVTCDRQISFVDRDEIYYNLKEQFKDRYNLKRFDYSKEDWIIVSSQFSGDTRLESKRHKFSQQERDDIVDSFIDILEQLLQIILQDWRDFHIK